MQEIADDRLAAAGVRLLLQRDDLRHPELPGGKWRKLKHNLDAAGGRPILTFGGAWSNHIRATAFLGHERGFPTIGVIRGEERPTPVLASAAQHGMTLRYVTRGEYRAKDVAPLRDEFGDFHLVPEGGANAYGVRGCAELPAEIDEDFDVFCCAAGTGTMLAGVASALRPGQRAIGFSVLKGGAFLRDDVARLQESAGAPSRNWSIETEFHFGGYARRTPALDAFLDDFRVRHDVVLDRVYEAKMMYGLFELAARREITGTVVALLA
ncbi:pyridoxal-phosphate dependent enzyme [Actinoplanes sp. TBRC 11911]|uniref:1-aminocyclopropane-1-carboxylate deaminase/D-cysteine desulfhydrase n=1 Tax=Actinoplanes sp. TBRC 11911 TaxID=2729386 RepID=UPI00145E41E0|nr:pyridoxal-phosphate dependent enzyme [Actinoplanes sp. TBRC 11911]NMO52990.1 pyridoxal-phosphate dependent enzyme [Actinoplanes sp. TBRC 11911]